MEIAEHFYTDDPAVGHPDVRTRLSDTDYFFLGNGLVQAAVQICRSGEGTPVGLLILDPERLGPKRAALTLDEDAGLEGTMLEVEVGDELFAPCPARLGAGWEGGDGTPTVRVEWEAGPARVTERFSCPLAGEPEVRREVEVREGEEDQRGAVTGFTLIYRVVEGEGGPEVEVRRLEQWGHEGSGQDRRGPPGSDESRDAGAYWASLSTVRSGDPGLDHLFGAARRQLPVAVDGRGRMDGSIWQYNLEWVRDQAHVAEALVRLGDTALAATMLARLLDEFVSPEGDTVDSGTRRPPDEVELDQNGELLAALATYVDWTGDLELVGRRWERVRALADFPLQERFRHRASGLLHNRREYWERHAVHGIEDGFELMSQFFVVLGLEGAARLAGALGRAEDASAWREAARGLWDVTLHDPTWSLVEEGHLIKRRGTDGRWQRTIRMTSGQGLPEAIPLLQEGSHYLDPDASSALPIAHGFVDPRGGLARDTLRHLEGLWNAAWDGGGYGRYHVTSEPDSPGAWPFPSLFLARAYAEAGEDGKVWRILRWLSSTSGGRAGSWFENHGPRIAPPYPQVGITPWTWAELVTLFVHHLLGVRPDGEGITIRPRLLEGLESMEACIPLRGHRLQVRVRAAGPGEVPHADGLRLPHPDRDTDVEVLC